MPMREKLLDLMKTEGLKSSQLAEILGVNPAGISHILAGRNKPGFDLLQKMLRRFPRISPDWLLLDSGPMYRDPENTGIAMTSNHGPASTKESATPLGDLFTSKQPAAPTAPTSIPAAPTAESLPPENPKRRQAAIKRVVIFYDDDSFEAYFPTMR